MYTTIKTLKKPKKLKNPVLIVGLPGIGLVGKIAVDYAIKQLNPKPIAEIYCDNFPPAIRSVNGILDPIRDFIYLYKGKKRDILFLAGPVQPLSDPRGENAFVHYEFARKIVEYVKSLGVKEIYTLAGINVGDNRLSIEPKVVVAATDKKIRDTFKKLGAKWDKQEVLISNAAGLILKEGIENGMKGACLMGETNAKLFYGDAGAAKAVLEIITKKFSLEIRLDEIEKSAKEMKRLFNEILMQQKNISKEEKKEEKLPYVR